MSAAPEVVAADAAEIPKNISSSSFEVVPVLVLSDNFAYLIIDNATKTAASVDAVEPKKVLAEAERRGVALSFALCTHRHADHSGGNEALRLLRPDVDVYGSAYEDTPGINKKLREADELLLGQTSIRVYHTPCHTRGHLSFFVSSSSGDQKALPPALFTGDFLFVGGCGRFFEGDAKQMMKSLQHILDVVPETTKIYCGHEYTLNNLRFASFIEPENAAIAVKLRWAEEQKQNGSPTVPSTIEAEKTTNPFFRFSVPEVKRRVADLLSSEKKNHGDTMETAETTLSDEETMAALREMKNNFKGK